jgi:SAM-dependent methyltransferase
VRFGTLHRLSPISRAYGFDRGLPIDRYYIEHFLAHAAPDIHGRVLEVGDDEYTKRFGQARVTTSDVLHVTEGNPKATIVADLASAHHIPSDTFDCVILTQTLQLIYDLRAAVKTVHRILKPGGLLLATLPGISPIARDEWAEQWCWSFTHHSARRLLEEYFQPTAINIAAYGNVLTAIAFLHGLAAQELHPEELNHHDPGYHILITVRAAKERRS